jgi:glycerophosphoryl diester phosphodiesterase
MKIIGHRGARGLASENTLAAIEQALIYKVDEIEIDVRVTSDGRVVLSHDSIVMDLSGHKMIISHCSLGQLSDAKSDLCTLEAAISLIKRRVPLLIEVKTGEPLSAIIAVIQKYLELGWQAEDFRLASFNQKTLRGLHAALPQITKVVNAKFSAVYGTHRVRQLATKRININNKIVWFGLVQSLSSHGYQLTVHNINTSQEIRTAKCWGQRGLYGVITDYPDRTTSLRV